jgi:predicted alpha-1,2-mannosidase
MKQKKLWIAAASCVLFSGLAWAQQTDTARPASHAAAKPQPAASVDPLIGTGKGAGGSINMYPGAVMPFGMVQLSPDTESNSSGGYHYDQANIQGFSMTHMSGMGDENEGDVFFIPTTGPIETAVTDFQSPYSHSQEAASPGYYRALLERWGINAELTATVHTGMARFTFPAGKAANILVPISHTLDRHPGNHAPNPNIAAQIRVEGDREIAGFVEDQVPDGDQAMSQVWARTHNTFKVYFVMVFSQPFSTFGTWQGDKPEGPGQISASSRSTAQTRLGQWIGAYATWPASMKEQTIEAKVGISYVDEAGARNNLKTEAEGKSFGEIRSQAGAAWNKALGAIEVSGGSVDERKVFYTGLYHSLLMPSVFSDVDGRYVGFDDQVHTVAAGHAIYDSYSGWDIYRSAMPLLALVDPARVQDMAQSIVLMYQQGGWIGRWPFANRYTNSMAGSPLTIVMSMAWLNGLHGFDIDAAWQGMLRDATEAPAPGSPYVGEDGIEWINKLHYAPNDKVDRGSVSQLQEDCLAYASLFHLAVELGKTDDAKMLYERALYYRNLFNPETRFFSPRNADGQWMPDFDPDQGEQHGPGIASELQQMKPDQREKMVQAFRRMRAMSPAERQQFLQSPQVQQNFSPQEQNLLQTAVRLMARPSGWAAGFIEGSGLDYEWFAPEDLAWLIQAVGKDLFNQRLQKFFSYPTPGVYGQYYNPYDETDVEAPYEFNFSGMPWEGQRVVRRILSENYTTSPDGVPGNDDCGAMSSWAVMSMMGIYTVDPASLAYELVSPVFSKVVIHLHAPYTGKTFTIETSANADAMPYIQSVRINGKAHRQNWIPFSTISSGGRLQIALGPQPNKAWGSAPEDAPPSLSEHPLDRNLTP